MTLLNQFKATIKKYGLIVKGDKILVGVSGGPDSLTLLYLLNSIKKEFRLTLHIAHLDHGLRKDSNKDLEFVKGLAKRLKIPVTTKQINLSKLQKRDSLEQAARNIRLDFLIHTAKKADCHKISLGHNFDDQAETVLMRLIRGTGLYGLAGILPERKIKGMVFIRPLLEIKRKDIEKYLKQKKIIPRRDPTNRGTLFLRNRIRNKLIPLLEHSFNPKIKEILVNTAENAGLDYAYLKKIGQKALASCSVLKQSSLSINLKQFLKYHLAIQRLLLRLAIEDLIGNTRRLTYKHWHEIRALIYHRPIGSIVDLPRISVHKKKSSLQLSLR